MVGKKACESLGSLPCRQDRMAVVGELAAGLAHEIRNPLAGISASIEMLKGTGSDPREPENQRLMEIAIRDADGRRLLGVTADGGMIEGLGA